MLPFERTLLRQLFGNDQFARRVMPYLEEEFFLSVEAAAIFRLFAKFFVTFKALPSFPAIRIGLDATMELTEPQGKASLDALIAVEAEQVLDASQDAWMLVTTEAWVKERKLYCALRKAIRVMEDKTAEHGVIPSLMQDALAVSFDPHVGHDYFEDAAARYEFYHKAETRLPFSLPIFNRLTNGGVPSKTLNVVLAGTNVGKSLALCNFAADFLASSKNVLYITCEMAQEWIAQRIDGNLFNMPMDDVVELGEAEYLRHMAHIRQTSTGRLFIKEYSTGTAHTGHFRTLLQELQLKQHFKPDVLFVDYLTICASERVGKIGGSVNGALYYKSIAEELRSLAVEANLPLFAAAQFNREGYKSTDPGMEHTGESFAIGMTSDFCVGLVTSDELERLGQIQVIELKTRYRQKRSYEKHLLGIDTPRMKLYELSAAQVAQTLSLPPSSPTVGQPRPSLGAFSFSRDRRSKPMASLVAETAKVDD